MSQLQLKAKTAWALGFMSLFRVLKYRLSVRIGLNSVQKLTAQLPRGNFFASPRPNEESGATVTDIPNWFYNRFSHRQFKDTHLPWYQIPDFDEQIGDIKGIWEISRMQWVLDFVVRERKQQDGLALIELDCWLNDWCCNNPAYFGPNWKCGQEASIRVMHLIAAYLGLPNRADPQIQLLDLIHVHLQRISPTIDYAIAQNNNHGTSEATALYIGGVFLNHFRPSSQAKQWQDTGRYWLENRAKCLIMADGGFSQYSVNYHRVMLDSYCLAEIVRRQFDDKTFSIRLQQQLQRATDWLHVLTQVHGNAPNLGANDGARLLVVSATDYADFRPSVQLASTLFVGHSYYQTAGTYDQVLVFFALEKMQNQAFELPSKQQFFQDSGLMTATVGPFFLAFKLPIFHFRPSQCDSLHLDVWWHGENLLRDGGTYSYNSTLEDLDYFSGTASHNTVQFDDHLQMPRLSRFLFGDWLKPKNLHYAKDHWRCGYQDAWGGQHEREIILTRHSIRVIDRISDFKRQAILRWRLQPDHWVLTPDGVSNGQIMLQLERPQNAQMHLIQGEESRNYYQKNPLPVLEITVTQPTTIVTIIKDLT